MTNAQIILTAAIETGIYTEDQAQAIIEKLGSLPLHTFAEWKKLGFIVKKGEKARLAVDIWMKSNKKIQVETQEGNEQEVDAGRFYKKLSHFFTFDQVQKITA